MLPDFASMCRGRLTRAADPDVQDGIDLHHRTDGVFHTSKSFTGLESHALARFTERGVSRGAAMATAHIGVELLLDGILLDNRDACALYLAAIEHATATLHSPGHAIGWAKPEQISRWHALCSRLRAYGLPEGYRDLDTVARRLAMILSGYPSLAFTGRDQERVRAELDALRDRVAGAAPGLMAELRRGLDHTGPETGSGAQTGAKTGSGPARATSST
jgi:acyl carrier protein phosphodiesterase